MCSRVLATLEAPRKETAGEGFGASQGRVGTAGGPEKDAEELWPVRNAIQGVPAPSPPPPPPSRRTPVLGQAPHLLCQTATPTWTRCPQANTQSSPLCYAQGVHHPFINSFTHQRSSWRLCWVPVCPLSPAILCPVCSEAGIPQPPGPGLPAALN